MPNEQLLAYIREQVSRGVIRGDITKALILAGWRIKDINVALIALSVPMDTGTSGISPGPAPLPTPAPAQTPQIAPAQETSMPSSPISNTPQAPQTPPAVAPQNIPSASKPPMIVSPARAGEGTPPGTTYQVPPVGPVRPQSSLPKDAAASLPGVFELIGSGIRIYRDRFGVLAGLGILSILVWFIPAAAAFAGFFYFAASGSSGLPALPILFAGIIIFIILCGVAIYLGIWMFVATLHAIRGAGEKLGIGSALGRARAHIGGYIWILLLRMLVAFGAVAVFGALPALLFFVIANMLGDTIFMTFLPVIAGVVGLVVSLVVFSTWFLFSEWLLIDKNIRGISALQASKRIIQPNFWSILWRFLGVGIVFGLFALFVYSIPILISLLTGVAFVAEIARLVAQVFDTVFLYPMLFASLYILYCSVKDDVSVPEKPGKGWLKALAITGALGFIVVPVAIIFLMSTVSSVAKDNANDARRMADIKQIELALALYYDEYNKYPTSLAELAPNEIAFLPADPVTQKSYAYSAAPGGTSYSLCATETSGASYCGEYSTSSSSAASLSPQSQAVSSSAALEEGWATYTDAADGFSFNYPKIGQLATGNSPPAIDIGVPGGDTMGVYIINAPFNPNDIQDSRGSVTNAYPTTLGGKPAHEYTDSTAPGCSSRSIQMALGQKTLMVTFTSCATNPSPHFDAAVQTKVLSSFVFTK